MKLNLCVNCMSDMGEASICPKCGYDEHTSTQSGSFLKRKTILNGRYLVGNAMGQGGFGITYIGFDMLLNTKVAIKEYFPMGNVVRDNMTGNTVQWTSSQFSDVDWKAGCDKFLVEAQKMAKLNAVSGIVSVHDTFYENDTSYIVMDYVEGITLKNYIKKEGLISYEKIIGLFSPLLKSLAKAHKNGLVHRDISPDNIMINEDGELMLLDLGAAKDLNINSNEFSMPVMKMGFSPAEQYMTKGEIGPWTDVYAMCATIYYCMYGKVPPDSMERLMTDELTFPDTAFGKLPDDFVATLTAGLASRNEERIQTMNELLDGLEGKRKFEKRPEDKNITMPVYNNAQSVNLNVYPTTPISGYNVQPVNNATSKNDGNKKKKTAVAFGSVALIAAVIVAVLLIVKPFSKSERIETPSSSTTVSESITTEKKTTEAKTTTEKTTETTTEEVKKNDEKIYIYAYNGSGFETILEYFYDRYPEYKDRVIYKNINVSSSDLSVEVNHALNSDEVPSIVIYDYDDISELSDTSVYCSMDELGISDIDTSYMYEYTLKSATFKNKLMGLSYYVAPGGFIYNTDIAMEVFGTSDPDVIGEYFKTWDGVLEAGALLKSSGYYLVSNTTQVARCMGDNYNQSVIDTMISKGYSKEVEEWTAEETDSNGYDTFGVFGTTWYFYCLGRYDDTSKMPVAVCTVPEPYYWGGTVMGVTKECPDKELAGLVLSEICCNYGTLYDIADNEDIVPNNSVIVEGIAMSTTVPDNWKEISSTLLMYNPMGVFGEIAEKIK